MLFKQARISKHFAMLYIDRLVVASWAHFRFWRWSTWRDKWEKLEANVFLSEFSGLYKAATMDAPCPCSVITYLCERRHGLFRHMHGSVIYIYSSWIRCSFAFVLFSLQAWIINPRTAELEPPYYNYEASNRLFLPFVAKRVLSRWIPKANHA